MMEPRLQEKNISDEQLKKKPQKIPNTFTSFTATSSVMFIFFASLAAYLYHSQRDQPFKPFIDTTTFFDEMKPKIYAGEVHYPRIPLEYWDHRIKMIKAMGMNTLSVYTFWNYHEVTQGVFDFETGNRNLSHFLQLAMENDMKVLIRPGPYVCAQWDLGGLPPRLLGIKGLILRSSEPQFLKQTKLYFQALAPIISKYLWSPQHPNNPIIMLQIQNQYGFYGTDRDYMFALRQMWHDLKIRTSEYYVDWFINIRKSYWPGANIGLNDVITQFQIDYIHSSLDPRTMVFGGEIYSGWITYWHKDQMEKRAAQDKIKQYEFLMSHNISYSMYMAHGGTNFGITAGANSAYQEQLAFGGQLTTYDYDAPINEQGGVTEKYRVFREVIKKYADWPVPEVPDAIPMMKIPAFKPTLIANLLENIDWSAPKAVSDEPLYFQSDQLKMYHPGIVIYRTTLPAKSSSQYMIRVHDLGYIKIDNKHVMTLDRTLRKHNKVTLSCTSQTDCALQIIVEAMGHINYDLSMQEDQKGLREFYIIDNPNKKFKWRMWTLPIDESVIFSWDKLSTDPPTNDITLHKMTLILEENKDTYLDMRQFYKGFIWVNGYNLGRYWNVGPQLRLYCPGVWLKVGENQIYVLDMLYDGEHEITGELALE